MPDIDSNVTIVYSGLGVCDLSPCNASVQQTSDHNYVFSAKICAPPGVHRYALRVDNPDGSERLTNHYSADHCQNCETCEFAVQLPEAGAYRWTVWAEDLSRKILVVAEKCDFEIIEAPQITCPQWPSEVAVYQRNCVKISDLFPGIEIESLTAPESDDTVSWEFTNGTDGSLCYTAPQTGDYTGTLIMTEHGRTHACAVQFSVTQIPDMQCVDDCVSTTWDTAIEFSPKANDLLPFAAAREIVEGSAVGPGSWSWDNDQLVWTPDNQPSEQITSASVQYRITRRLNVELGESHCVATATVVILPPSDFDICTYTGCDVNLDVAVCGSNTWYPVGLLTGASLERRWGTRTIRKLNRGKRGKSTRRTCSKEWSLSLEGEVCANDRGQAILAHSPQLQFRIYTQTPDTGIVWSGTATTSQISTPFEAGEENGTFSATLEGSHDLSITRGW